MTQDTDTATNSIPESETTLSTKSWTAYVGIGLIAVFALLPITMVLWGASGVVGFMALIASALFVGYRVLMLRSYRLYHDANGVWLYSGFLPWNSGIAGVKWRDIDEAIYYQTLWSWLSKSYSVRIGHRFTKSNEIFLTHMTNGNETVMNINSMHLHLIDANVLK